MVVRRQGGRNSGAEKEQPSSAVTGSVAQACWVFVLLVLSVLPSKVGGGDSSHERAATETETETETESEREREREREIESWGDPPRALPDCQAVAWCCCWWHPRAPCLPS